MTSRVGKPDTEADRQLRTILDAESLKCFIMVAGAGSGKTTSLVKALDHILKSRGKELRGRGQKVACITYTEIAVQEIWGDVGNDPLFQVSTIHSFLWTLVTPFQNDIRTWVTSHIEEKLAELREKANNFSSRTKQATRDRTARDIERYQVELARVGSVNHFVYGTGSNYSKGILGHDDILKLVPALIEKHELFRKLVGQRFPFIFVDESQDTSPVVVNALKAISRTMGNKLCLGFFGDPMQKIYATGIGEIELEDGWVKIEKPENFRCPTNVLAVINNIRAGGDTLIQTRGRTLEIDGRQEPVSGTARLFILPIDDKRTERLQEVRSWLARENNDPSWLNDDKSADVKVLVIVHRMAAIRLGFGELYAALNDGAPYAFKEGFKDGTLWAIKPFLNFILPIVIATSEGLQFEVMSLLRAHSPLLSDSRIKGADLAAVLNELKQKVRQLALMLSSDSNSKVVEVLQFAHSSELLALDERLIAYLSGKDTPVEHRQPEEDGADTSAEESAIQAYFNCLATQFWGYLTYIEEQSPFSTQQGIKGAEFERVLAVLDDAEGKHVQFSYDKYFGLVNPSETDTQNQAEGKETVIDRTRRLFYVCCSRAVRDLAVVLFTSDVEYGANKVKEAEIFEDENIHILRELCPAL
jgi:DNA helicase-2/ATP-dependent DNA helicase PcrA